MTSKQEFIEKLRNSSLRPTKQRINICEVLFNRDKTFHFTINDLFNLIKDKTGEKVSLATVYNTVNSNQTYFDTNVTDHHHFFDVKEEKLIDLKNEDVGPIEIQKSIPGKKIKSVEVLVKLED